MADDSVTIRIKCTRDAAEGLIPLLKELERLGRIGASRGIKIEDYDGRDSFGFDGDGSSRIEEIKMEKSIKLSPIEAKAYIDRKAGKSS